MMDPCYRVANSAGLPSPSLLVYPEKIRRNTATALAIAGSPERLWPHVKTHKTAQIVALQQAAGIRKFKCATVAEAEMLARCGVKEILFAYQPVGPTVFRLLELCRRHPEVSLKLIADEPGVVAAISEAFGGAGREVEVLLDIDPGMGRTGVPPDQRAAELYLELGGRKGIVPGGLHCFDGQNNQVNVGERLAAALDCLAALDRLQERIERGGGRVPRRILGGTPTFPCYAGVPDAELSPGTCFLQDWNTLKRFKDLPFQPAALLFTRVVSKPAGGRITVDAGSKAIATDPPIERGIVFSAEGLRPLFQSEEHWVFETREADRFRVGEELYILPTHICPTFALHQSVHVVDASGRWVDSWPVAARDRKLSV
jgi:D-serine deaminase-like pyridoxal phosphate-dependent protein